MALFEDIDEVQDWLEPLGYTAFWEAVAPWAVFPEGDQEHCDRIIADGIAPQETVLFCLKAMARTELTERFGLKDRVYEPIDRQYLASTH